MSEDKNTNTASVNVFKVAGDISQLLAKSGLSKTQQRKALSLVAAERQLRLAPVGVPLGQTQTLTGIREESVGVKVGKANPNLKQKLPINRDPAVVAAKATLDDVQKRIRIAKASGQEFSELLIEQTAALAALKGAKSAFDAAQS